MTRNWQEIFQHGGNLEDAVVRFLQELEQDILTALSGGGGGIQNPLTADLNGGGHDLLNFNDIEVSGLSGATAGARFVGGTTTGHPTTGSFLKGDFVVDQTGTVWICTVAGTPGTWVDPSAAAGGGGGGSGEVWQSASPLGSTKRPAVQLLMSTYDTVAGDTDHTVAVQAALDAAGALILADVGKVQIILDSRMVYNIGGAVTAGSNGEWAQLHWPFSEADSTTGHCGTIELIGMPGGEAIPFGFQGGTVIRCTLTSAPAYSAASHGIASMFGGPASFKSPDRTFLKKNLILMSFKNINIRGGASGPVICGIDAGYVMGLFIDQVAFDTDQASEQFTSGGGQGLTWTKYNAPQGVPLICPQVNCYWGTRGGAVLFYNWPTGPILGEASNFDFISCALLSGPALNLEAAYHISHINYLLDVVNPYGIAGHDPSSSSYVVTATPASRTTPGIDTGKVSLMIDSWDVERNNGDDEAGVSQNRVYDLWAAVGNVYVDARYTHVKGGIGVQSGPATPILIAGYGTDLSGGYSATRILDTYLSPGPHVTAGVDTVSVPATDTYIRNPYSRDALVAITAGAYEDQVVADGAVGLWFQSDTSGTTMVGAVGGYGTYFNSPTFSQAGISNTTRTATKYASASTQYATVGIDPGNTTTDLFTFEVWVKRTTIGGASSMGLLNRVQSTGAPGAGPLLQFNSTNHIEILSSQVALIGASAGTVTDTTGFHHIVWTKNGSTNKLYLDGADITPSISNQTFAAPGSGAKYAIASDSGSIDGLSPLNGTLAMVAVYRSALSAATVLNHYNLGSGVTTGSGLTSFNIDGSDMGTTGPFLVPANAVVKIAYTRTPAWTWTTI